MLSKNLIKNSVNNVENEKIYYRLIDNYYETLDCKNKSCNRLDEFKKTVKFFVKYLFYLKKSKENNLEFVMTILHDIKSPIIGINYALKTIKVKNDILENIYKTNKSVLYLIKDLLAEYNFNSDYSIFNIEKINPSDILKHDIAFLDYIIRDKNLDVIKVINYKDNINSNKNALIRIFSNLLSNAIKYANTNSQVTIKLFKEKKHLVFSVKNECKNQISNNIFRHIKYEKGGFGLGLYIVKKNIAKLKGKIRIKNPNNSVIIEALIPLV